MSKPGRRDGLPAGKELPEGQRAQGDSPIRGQGKSGSGAWDPQGNWVEGERNPDQGEGTG